MRHESSKNSTAYAGFVRCGLSSCLSYPKPAPEIRYLDVVVRAGKGYNEQASIDVDGSEQSAVVPNLWVARIPLGLGKILPTLRVRLAFRHAKTGDR